MDSRTQERVERWESRSFSGDRDELATLADTEFSGAITAADTWLFMLNGRIVGVVDGDLTDTLDVSGTIYEAPADALPLLMAMLEQGGETRGTYYTNETPLSEVDRKLQQGSFTGYVELSEQVLSGDYYAVYYGGRRMSAAYIGNAERLLTGEEAFERADDEIGLYAVVTVEVSVTDVPGRDGGDEPTTETDPAGAPDDSDAAVPADRAANSAPSASPDATPSTTDTDRAADIRESGSTERGDDPAEASTPETEVSYTETDPSAEDATTAGTDSPTSGSSRAGAEPEPTNETDDNAGITTTSDVAEPESSGITTVDEADPSNEADGDPAPGATESDLSGANEGGAASQADDDSDEPDERFKEEERWRETRRIPSIDPENSTDEAGSTNAQSSGARSSGSSRSATNAPTERAGQSAANDRSGSADRRSTTRPRTDEGDRAESGQSDRTTGPSPEDVASTEQALRSELEREDRVDQLTQRVTELEERRKQLVRERDELEAENEDLTDLVEQLQDRIEELEAKLERERAETSATAASPSQGGQAETSPASDRAPTESTRSDGIALTAQQAFEQTNVFVRYESKSQPTLEAARDGEGSRGDLARNLQLERHTQFDAATASVDGQPYESFVEESMRYRFVEWLVGTCLFEIRETGHADGLGDLYDVIPRIDRVELSATVSLEEDDTENVPDRVTFDVAAFDKRGTPLVVANCNDSRDPATRGMLETLEADASAVCANYPDLGAAVVVTSSFFDPGALELAEEVTSSGFLNRSSKLSYVSLSRKQGYHCCLVESRSGGFHLSVPEL